MNDVLSRLGCVESVFVRMKCVVANLNACDDVKGSGDRGASNTAQPHKVDLKIKCCAENNVF